MMTDSTISTPAMAATQRLAIPRAWFGSDGEKAFGRRLAEAAQRVLLLDYDGTLAPFHPDKMKAFPYPGVETMLQELNRRADTRIVLVTGRRPTDLPDLMGFAKDVEIWGSHGREHKDRDGQYTLYPPTSEQSAALALLHQELETCSRDVTLDSENVASTTQGPRDHMKAPEPLERKPASLAVHWRGLTAESQKLLRECADDAYRVHGNASLECMPFESGIEFRAVGYTKAHAVAREVERSAEDSLIAYLGDDLTDEDAFAALGPRGEAVLVRSQRRPSHAGYWIKPPEELLLYLHAWL